MSSSSRTSFVEYDPSFFLAFLPSEGLPLVFLIVADKRQVLLPLLRSSVLCCWVTICRAWGKEMLFSTFTLCTSFSRSHTEHFFEEVPWGPAHCAGYTFSTFVAALLWMFSTTAMADSFIITESSTMAKLLTFEAPEWIGDISFYFNQKVSDIVPGAEAVSEWHWMACFCADVPLRTYSLFLSVSLSLCCLPHGFL